MVVEREGKDKRLFCLRLVWDDLQLVRQRDTPVWGSASGVILHKLITGPQKSHI